MKGFLSFLLMLMSWTSSYVTSSPCDDDGHDRSQETTEDNGDNGIEVTILNFNDYHSAVFEGRKNPGAARYSNSEISNCEIYSNIQNYFPLRSSCETGGKGFI